jgi:hypothetical protein
VWDILYGYIVVRGWYDPDRMDHTLTTQVQLIIQDEQSTILVPTQQVFDRHDSVDDDRQVLIEERET